VRLLKPEQKIKDKKRSRLKRVFVENLFENII
jgi:hypothetical protein